MNDPQPRLETVFNAAKALPPADREAYLGLACHDNPALRREVDRLLAAAASADTFFESKPVGLDDPGSTLGDTTVPEGPGTAIGRYKLLQQIGEGGMGIVYMAEQTEPVVRKVALKIIKLGMDTRSVVARFEAERQALALMDHPNIAKVLDGGATESGRPYFVMELVRGIPITEFCDRNHLSARQRLELFIPVCQAIQHAHQKGIIHRDIKPSNVLVTLHDGAPLPMVIDFGIAKATNQKLTEKTLFTNFAQMIGTPAYMSPEQAEMSRLDVDTRTDIYSLGVLLYELLTGTTPFTAKELMDAGYGGMQRIIAEKEPPRPSTRLGTMRQAQRTTVAENRRMEPAALTRLFQGDLDWVVMKCLEKERGRRYETATGLAADLQRHLRTEPVSARPPTAAYRLQKAIRRNRLAFAAVAAVVVTLILGFAVASWQAVRATRAERQQAELRERAEQAASNEAAARQAAVTAKGLAETSEEKAQRLLYAANMNLIQAAWEQNNIGLVRRLLGETATSSHRGFEWYYWQRETHGELFTLRGHREQIWTVAYSPDGKRILTGSLDGTVKMWDAIRGRELFSIRGASNEVCGVAFSPDGRRFVTGGTDQDEWRVVQDTRTNAGPVHAARIWDSESGKELLKLKGHVFGINSVAYFPDGRRIATTGGKGRSSDSSSSGDAVKIWDAVSGEESLTLRGEKSGGFSEDMVAVAVSPDGRRIAAIDGDGKVHVWDSSTGKELVTCQADYVAGRRTFFMLSVAFSSDGKRMITTGDELVKIWDSETGAEVSSLRTSSRGIMAAAFSPDGRWIAVGGGDSTVKLWEAATGRELREFKGHTEGLNCVVFSPDGSRLVSAAGSSGVDAEAKVWDLKDLEGVELPRDVVTDFMYLGCSDDGQRIVSVKTNLAIRISDSLTGKEILSFPRGSFAFPFAWGSLEWRRVVTQDANHQLEVREVESGKIILSVPPIGTNGVGYALSPSGGHMALTGWGQRDLKIWDVSAGRVQSEIVLPDRWPSLVALSPGGTKVICGAWARENFFTNAAVAILDAVSGNEIVVLEKGRFMAYGAKFSPDGLRIVGNDGRIPAVWDAATGRRLTELRGHTEEVTSIAFSPSGSRLITAGTDSTVRIWDSTSGRELLRLKIGSDVRPMDCFISRDEGRVLVGLMNSAGTEIPGGPRLRWDGATPQQVARWEREEREDGERAGAGTSPSAKEKP